MSKVVQILQTNVQCDNYQRKMKTWPCAKTWEQAEWTETGTGFAKLFSNFDLFYQGSSQLIDSQKATLPVKMSVLNFSQQKTLESVLNMAYWNDLMKWLYLLLQHEGKESEDIWFHAHNTDHDKKAKAYIICDAANNPHCCPVTAMEALRDADVS